jgi:hypothetical protein
VGFSLLSGEVSSGDAVVVLETPRCEGNDVDGSLDALSLISDISVGVPAVVIEHLWQLLGQIYQRHY